MLGDLIEGIVREIAARPDHQTPTGNVKWGKLKESVMYIMKPEPMVYELVRGLLDQACARVDREITYVS